MSLFKKKKLDNRACVIGLDGVPYGLLRDFMDRGVMSATRRLMDGGRLHRMKASLPEISSVSWSSFMTGTNPGTHGIFGFTDFKPGSYDIRFPNYSDLKAKPLWDILGEKGRRSIVINQPATYPAREMNGILVSGFVALDLARAVTPRSLLQPLERAGYRIDIDTVKSRENTEFFWRDLSKTLSGRQKALNLFWKEEWDYFEFVITGTDRLHHYLWNAGADPDHPHHRSFLEYYRRIDQLIDKIAVSFRKSTGGYDGLYLMSDHGFCGIETEVYLNVWLEREGYLSFSKPNPDSLNDIAMESRAFALDPNRIYLHLEKKFPRGSVAASERKALIQEIAGRLAKLEWNGRKVVRKAFPARDIYSGPLTAQGPDLIVLGERGFDMKGSVKKTEIFGKSGLQGMHTWDDAFFWSVNDHGDDLAIEDLAGIILKRF
ncbi:MAG: alkaline phosphatase family protein [Acidobacteriota bacterium]|nr:alkaline phosphatase family protein [Acidobacteriota bacterium]